MQSLLPIKCMHPMCDNVPNKVLNPLYETKGAGGQLSKLKFICEKHHMALTDVGKSNFIPLFKHGPQLPVDGSSSRRASSRPDESETKMATKPCKFSKDKLERLQIELMFAAYENNVETARRVLRQELPIDFIYGGLSSPLITASSHGNTEIVRLLTRAPGSNVNRQLRDGATALYMAAINDHFDIVKHLVQNAGADASLSSADGCTPLFAAAHEGYPDIVEFLAKRSPALVNQPDNHGYSPLYIASHQGQLGVARLLGESLGANVNQNARDGSTPLIIAADKGQVDIVRLLVEELGADVAHANKEGVTATRLAVQHGHLQILKILAGHSALKNADELKTLLYTAVHCNQLSVVRFLLQNDGYLLESGFERGTLLKLAMYARRGEPPGRRELVEYIRARMKCGNATCAGQGLLKCARCLTTRYCSRSCQKKHWGVHKVSCSET